MVDLCPLCGSDKTLKLCDKVPAVADQLKRNEMFRFPRKSKAREILEVTSVIFAGWPLIYIFLPGHFWVDLWQLDVSNIFEVLLYLLKTAALLSLVLWGYYAVRYATLQRTAPPISFTVFDWYLLRYCTRCDRVFTLRVD